MAWNLNPAANLPGSEKMYDIDIDCDSDFDSDNDWQLQLQW